MNDLLPVGSVVFLYNNKKCMIIGYSPNKNNSDDNYDYVCCDNHGLKNNGDNIKLNEDYFYIKKDEIKKVTYIGFSDKEFDIYEKGLHRYIAKLEDIKKTKKEIEYSDIETIMEDIFDYFEKEGRA